jgi:hypothetical protein
MPNLLDKLWQRKADRQTSAIAQYKALLYQLAESDSEPTAKEIEALDSLTGQLGFDRERVEDDLNALKVIRAKTPVAAEADKLRQVQLAAGEKRNVHAKHIEKEKHRLDLEQAKLHGEVLALGEQWRTAVECQKAIEDLKRKCPHLF